VSGTGCEATQQRLRSQLPALPSEPSTNSLHGRLATGSGRRYPASSARCRRLAGCLGDKPHLLLDDTALLLQVGTHVAVLFGVSIGAVRNRFDAPVKVSIIRLQRLVMCEEFIEALLYPVGVACGTPGLLHALVDKRYITVYLF
jgi:hypothetical protein